MPKAVSKKEARLLAGRMRARAALERWKKAQSFFECAEDEELIDFAIFDMEAARRKYILLLKRVE